MAIVSIFSDVELSKPRAWVFVLWCLILAANAAVCVLFGLRSLRRQDEEIDAPAEEWTDDDRGI